MVVVTVPTVSGMTLVVVDWLVTVTVLLAVTVRVSVVLITTATPQRTEAGK